MCNLGLCHFTELNTPENCLRIYYCMLCTAGADDFSNSGLLDLNECMKWAMGHFAKSLEFHYQMCLAVSSAYYLSKCACVRVCVHRDRTGCPSGGSYFWGGPQCDPNCAGVPAGESPCACGGVWGHWPGRWYPGLRAQTDWRGGVSEGGLCILV